MHSFTFVFLAALLVHGGLHLWLAERHRRHVLRHRARVPAEFSDSVPLAAHHKAADYTAERLRFGQFDLVLGHLLLLGWTLGGGLAWLDRSVARLGLDPIGHGVVFLLGAALLMALLDVPTSAWRTFVIEARHGFNRTTPRTFLLDLAKASLLTVLLGAPVAATMIGLMVYAGAQWWLAAWLAWTAFSVLLMWLFPRYIAPWFNRFRPLEPGALRSRIEALLERNGFASDGIFVMDGSTRSTHGNAYFTGVGRSKRIVFFDTLIDELGPEEIESVLAHELGHFKLRHVYKQLALMTLLSGAGLYVLGQLSSAPWFYAALGLREPSAHGALALFLLVAPLFGFVLQPLLAALSRRFEFEADHYAAEQSDAHALIRALVKLYRENAATLTPDPLYSAFHDSHPPAPLRVARLTALAR